jgi:archaeal type IV pilus assembly protein PilA
MDTRKPSIGVSPIIATLLLVAITVAAGVIVYVFVSGYTGTLTQGGGQQTAQQIELTAYAFTPLSGTTTCNGNTTMTAPCMIISLKNTGGAAVTIGQVYFDGIALTPNSVLSTTPITMSSQGNAVVLLVTSGSFTATKGGYTGMPASISGGSTHTLKIVTSSGALFSFTVTAGASQ